MRVIWAKLNNDAIEAGSACSSPCLSPSGEKATYRNEP